MTVEEPQETFICGSTLKKMILDIGDRDLKTYAMGMFLHGQILADQYHVDNWPDDLVDDLLNLTDDKGKNAMNEGIAVFVHGGYCLFLFQKILKGIISNLKAVRLIKY